MKNGHKLIDDYSLKSSVGVYAMNNNNGFNTSAVSKQANGEQLNAVKSKLFQNFNNGISYSQKYSQYKEIANISPRKVQFNSPRYLQEMNRVENPSVSGSTPVNNNLKQKSDNIKENYFTKEINPVQQPSSIFNSMLSSFATQSHLTSNNNNNNNHNSNNNNNTSTNRLAEPLKTLPNSRMTPTAGIIQIPQQLRTGKSSKNSVNLTHINISQDMSPLITQGNEIKRLSVPKQNLNDGQLFTISVNDQFFQNLQRQAKENSDEVKQNLNNESNKRKGNSERKDLNSNSKGNSKCSSVEKHLKELFQRETRKTEIMNFLQNETEIEAQIKHEIQNIYKNSTSFERPRSLKQEIEYFDKKVQSPTSEKKKTEQVESQMKNNQSQPIILPNQLGNNDLRVKDINNSLFINKIQKISSVVTSYTPTPTRTKVLNNLTNKMNNNHDNSLAYHNEYSNANDSSNNNNQYYSMGRRYSENQIKNITDIGKNELYKELEQKVNEIEDKLDKIKKNISDEDSSASFYQNSFIDKSFHSFYETSPTIPTPTNNNQQNSIINNNNKISNNRQFFFVEKATKTKKQNEAQSSKASFNNYQSLQESQIMIEQPESLNYSDRKKSNKSQITKPTNVKEIQLISKSSSIKKKLNEVSQNNNNNIYNNNNESGVSLEKPSTLSDYISQVKPPSMNNSQNSVPYVENNQSYQTIHKQIQQLQEKNLLNQSIDVEKKSMLKQIQDESDEILIESQRQLNMKKDEFQFIQDSQRYISQSFGISNDLYFVSQIINSHISNDFDDQFVGLCREHLIQCIQSLKYIDSIQIPNQDQIRDKIVFLPDKEILDLDETLIHCNEQASVPSDVHLPIQFPGNEIVTAGINVRPYVHDFLEEMSQYFEIIIFTASHSCYANIVLDYLDPEGKYFEHRFYRDSCIPTEQGIYVQDLRILGNRDLKDVLLVDNAAYSFGFQINNGIPIIPYYDNKKDTELISLSNYLKSIIEFEDLRDANAMNFNMGLYQEFSDPLTLLQKLYFRSD